MNIVAHSEVMMNGAFVTHQDFLDYLTADQTARFMVFRQDDHQRRGQAFFNVLSPEDQAILSGSLYDPFHGDSWDEVYRALAYLLLK